jgi:transcriptional regulator with XRE-family HTH domain
MEESQSPADAPGLGKRIAELRERCGWTQKQLADRAGMSVTFLSEVENGKRNLSSAKLLRIADELGASLDYLVRGKHVEARQRPPVSVPPELDDAAEEQGWSYPQTRALLQAQELIRARRSPGGADVPRTYTKRDWIDLYRRLFE